MSKAFTSAVAHSMRQVQVRHVATKSMRQGVKRSTVQQHNGSYYMRRREGRVERVKKGVDEKSTSAYVHAVNIRTPKRVPGPVKRTVPSPIDQTHKLVGADPDIGTTFIPQPDDPGIKLAKHALHGIAHAMGIV